MCRNNVVNVIEVEKESISTTITTCLRPYGNQALQSPGNVFMHVQTRSANRSYAFHCEYVIYLAVLYLVFLLLQVDRILHIRIVWPDHSAR